MIDPVIELVRGNTAINLNSLADYVRLSEDGLGLPEVRRLTERGPLQNGDTDIGYRIEPRTIQVVIGVFGGNDPATYWSLRRQLQRMLKPSTVPLALRYTLPTGEIRQLDVAYAGGLTWPSDERLITAHRAGFALRAADPTLYDPVEVSVVYEVGGSSGAWDIPWAVPWSIGSATVNATQAINNPGDWDAYPVITVVGPITNLVIRNLTTGDKLDFTGTTITVGEVFVIDTAYGVKSVIDGTGADRNATLTNDSNLATWRLLPDPEAPSGTNSVRVTGTFATDATSIFIRYNPRYIAL